MILAVRTVCFCYLSSYLSDVSTFLLSLVMGGGGIETANIFAE